jgi:hypothetical protein
LVIGQQAKWLRPVKQFVTDHFPERPSQSHLLVEQVEASDDRSWFAVQTMASLPCIYWGGLQPISGFLCRYCADAPMYWHWTNKFDTGD